MAILVSDVMLLCANLLKNKNLASSLSGELVADEKTSEERADYLRVYDMVTDELSCEYFPLTAEQCINADGGMVKLTSLNFAPLKIIAVFDNESGKKINYSLKGAELIVPPSNKIKIIYTHAAPPAAESDEFIYCATPGKFVVACGMAAQICLENGLVSEARVWRDKYDSAIRGRVAERRKLIIKPRRWL